MALGRPSSLRIFMDELLELEQTIEPAENEWGESLLVLRWRPTEMPELPALWHWIATSPHVQRDLSRWVEDLTIQIRVGVPTSAPTDEQHARLEHYFDRVREVLDPVFAEGSRPFQGAAYEAHRTASRTTLEVFNEIPVLCLEFDLRVQLSRQER